MTLQTYKGYTLRLPTSGGKAGKGCNKTSTVQVLQPLGSGSLLVKQVRFKVTDGHTKAVDTAKQWIDQQGV